MRWMLLLAGLGLNCGGSSTAETVFAEDFESGALAAWPDGGWLTRFFMPGYDSLYLSYHVRFPPDWVGGTKLIGFFGARTDNQWSAAGKAGTCPQGTDFFIAMVVTEQTGNPGDTRFYTYHPGMTREPDGVTCWGRYGDGTETYVPPLALRPGEWHHLEFMVKLNAPGESNGTQHLWIDGTLRGTWSGLRFRTSAVLRLNAVQLTFNRGIEGGPTAQKLWVDNLVVATQRP